MRVISKSRLRAFWEARGQEDAARPLQAWYSVAEKATWANWSDVKATYGSASLVGDCVVFNIAGNKYRLITRIRYRTQRIYILTVLTHKEYDSGRWVSDCGCHSPPPHPG